MRRVKAVVAALLLTACAACKTVGEPDVLLEGVRLPTMSEDELTCPVEPPVPQPRPGEPQIRESQLKTYILDLRAAGRACRNRLEVARRTWRAVEAKQREVSRAIRQPD